MVIQDFRGSFAERMDRLEELLRNEPSLGRKYRGLTGWVEGSPGRGFYMIYPQSMSFSFEYPDFSTGMCLSSKTFHFELAWPSSQFSAVPFQERIPRFLQEDPIAFERVPGSVA